MCQLLGMSGNTPTDICFSFSGFHARGGLTDVHRDGWGIAFFEGRGVRVFVDAQATVDSPVATLVRQYPIRSRAVIAHIRKATHGRVALENTHPFQRELWGRYWVFAHNGHLGDYRPALNGRFRPVGDTDSEHAFCWMLEHLALRGPAAPIDHALAELAGIVGQHGEFNFLLSDGDVLYAHCASRLSYIVREAPFGEAHLADCDLSIDFRAVTTPQDRVAVIATLPLTDNEAWHAIPGGTLVAFRDGQPIAWHPTGAACAPTARTRGTA